MLAVKRGRKALNRQVIDSSLRLDPQLRFVRPELKQLLSLWHEKRAGRPAPDRADFSPFLLKPYLPRILIYEIVGTPPDRRFRIRLYGTLVSQYSGRDPTGKYVDEVMDAQAYADFHRALTWLAEEAKPLRATGSYHFIDRSFVRFESITLPLTVGGPEVTQLLNITYYEDEA
jgi:hypothetical protein